MVEEKVAVVNKFSDYLNESGFYFANIANPNTTLFGNNVVQSKQSDKITTSKESKPVKTPTKKADVCDHHKLSTYLKIVNAIQ